MKSWFLFGILFSMMAGLYYVCQPVTLIYSSEASRNLALAMPNQNLSKIITENQPQIEVRIDSKNQKNVLVQSSPSPSYSVFSAAIDAFQHCDSMLRMIIDKKRLQSIRGDNFIEIKFRRPVALTIAYGGGKSLIVSDIVIPLSEKQTAPEWNFYYSENSQEWFALRWTQPDPQMLTRLKQVSQQLVRS
jgi:hypothetical protein